MSIGFPPNLIRPDFRIKYTQVQVTVTASRIIGESPDRVALIWFPVSIGDYFVAPYPHMTIGNGIKCNFAAAPIIIDYGTWGAITGDSWYGAVAAVPTTITVGEIIYSPKRS